MKKVSLLSTIVTLLFSLSLYAAEPSFETITFPSEDGLIITADLYMPYPATASFVLLFHQAGFSRGEYREIAPKLNALGFNAMAIDQRSGNEVHGVINETAKLAMEQNLPEDFIDALPDLTAAIDFAKENYAKGIFIIWGSSYSSCLVLKLAGDQPDIANAALAFSPGEYYYEISPTFIADSAKNITIPVFISSAEYEKSDWANIYDVIPAEGRTMFLPESGGVHGSSTLLESTPEHQQYWEAVEQFLSPFLSTPDVAPPVVPVITVNGYNDPVTLSDGEAASITISLSTTDSDNSYRDWWIFTETPFGRFFWVYPNGWQVEEERAISLPPLNFLDFPIPPPLTLPIGSYTFFFSVDANDDGIKDDTYLDTILVFQQ